MYGYVLVNGEMMLSQRPYEVRSRQYLSPQILVEEVRYPSYILFAVVGEGGYVA
jgi:hypothetical protein